MRIQWKRLGAVTAAATGALVMSVAVPAEAAITGSCTSSATCQVFDPNFTGGKASFDVDITSATAPSSWEVGLRVNGVKKCSTFVQSSDPVKSFTCTGLPAGSLSLYTGTYGGGATGNISLGLRPYQ